MERWGRELAAWAIPDEILSRAPESPWGFPAETFRRRAAAARAAPDTPSRSRAREALRTGDTVLDVGAGAGAASLPLAPPAARIMAVDPSESLLAEFRALAAAAGVPLEAVVGTWPDAADRLDPADVVVCHHVLYNVAELGPFVRAMTEHARRRVVVEITGEHPTAWMRPLWWRFHRLSRPEGPTADDAVMALRELGLDVRRDEFTHDRPTGGYGRRADAVAFVRRRLCLTADRDDEVADSLGDQLLEREGLWFPGPEAQRMVTLWWDV